MFYLQCVLCPPSNECGWVDVTVAHCGHGDDHAVHALKVAQALLVFKQRRVSVILNHVDEASRGPPDGNEHGNKLEKSENILASGITFAILYLYLIDLAVSRIFKY